MNIIIQSLSQILMPFNLMLITLGTLFGMVCGALPGLSSSMAIICACRLLILWIPFQV